MANPFPPTRAAVPPTLVASSAHAQLSHAMRAGGERMRFQLAGRMAKTAGAVGAAGALHGALGTPWGAIALAAAAAVAAFTAADVDDRADARSVVDGLGAVALYTAVRDACQKARAEGGAKEPPPGQRPEPHADDADSAHRDAAIAAAGASAAEAPAPSGQLEAPSPAAVVDRSKAGPEGSVTSHMGGDADGGAPVKGADVPSARDRGQGRRDARRRLSVVNALAVPTGQAAPHRVVQRHPARRARFPEALLHVAPAPSSARRPRALRARPSPRLVSAPRSLGSPQVGRPPRSGWRKLRERCCGGQGEQRAEGAGTRRGRAPRLGRRKAATRTPGGQRDGPPCRSLLACQGGSRFV
jgi:hypothetical protein